MIIKSARGGPDFVICDECLHWTERLLIAKCDCSCHDATRAKLRKVRG